jgi:hypothetical protein
LPDFRAPAWQRDDRPGPDCGVKGTATAAPFVRRANPVWLAYPCSSIVFLSISSVTFQ